MKFNEKIQELRKSKGLTQEELAQSLYVSRTAVSKWESGRGYPNIDSLKAIAKFFDLTIDELLSGDELLTIAEEDGKKIKTHFRDLVFGLLDVSVVVLLFLPFFGQNADGTIRHVSLLSLSGISSYLRYFYFDTIISTALFGVLTLALQNCQHRFWMQNKAMMSTILSIIGTVLFIISQQPYAAVFVFIFLLIKALTLIKRK
jgi:transcriptional regulator with XRE-family HTH domain